MFIKALQEKSARKALSKKLHLNQSKEVKGTPIQSVGIIVNADKTANFQKLTRDLQLNVSVEVLCYHKHVKKNQEIDYPFFTSTDFGWKGKAKSDTLKTFLEKPFDVLISYYSDDVLPLQLASGLQKANFKVGIAGSHQEIHDVIIQTKEEEIATFTKELHTYLHILNKL